LSNVHALVLGEIRERRNLSQASGSGYVPLIHAKLALLGELWWHDEDALGHIADVTGFRARRLWVSSVNFTVSATGKEPRCRTQP
jgi:hypothetical protein